MIEVNDYHKVYRDTVAVAGLSFRVEAGQMLTMFVKFAVVIFATGVAGGIGALAWWLAGESLAAGLAAALLVLASLGLALVPLVVSAFKNFDPSRDTPE